MAPSQLRAGLHARSAARRTASLVARTLAWALVMLVAGAAAAHGQRGDTLRPPAVVVQGAPIITTDTAPRPPISPRRAFLYSLAIPGSAQTILDRPRSAALFVTVEAVSITLARKAANDLREARRFARDSTVVTYQVDPVTGVALRDSTGALIPATYLRNYFGGDRVAARKTHFEDWIAALLFNHLISGAEAFVSAHLWDLPAQISMQHSSTDTRIIARIPW